MQGEKVGGHVQRSTLTPDALAAFWPEAHRRLVGRLCGQGVDPTAAEEAVAEAATRALSRGLRVADVDDFCRWAFVVARNVASDLHRRSQRLVPLESLVEQADRYDLAGDVEQRLRWHDTAHALKSLSPADRTALLSTVEGERSLTRREAVRDAVRRHRARGRLRQAMGHAGAFLGWLRRPRDWARPAASFLGRDDAVAMLLAAFLAVPAGSVAATTTATGIPTAKPGGVTDEATTTTSTVRAAAALRPPSTAGSQRSLGAGAGADSKTTGFAFEFTPSPSYDEDRTVFAAGSGDDCDDIAARCAVLFKSNDGGSSWEKLPAGGRDYGTIILPPAYPRDPRIFSAGLLLSVSTDGGATFRALGPAPGPATMSPLFSAGDPRILFGSDRALRSPTPMEYRDDGPVLVPWATPLAAGVLATDFWFGPGYVRDRRLFVAATEPPVAGVTGTQPTFPAETTALYECTERNCRRLVDLGTSVLPSSVAWSTRDQATMLVGSTWKLYRSFDAGRTFSALSLPGTDKYRRLHRLTAAPGGRLYASVTGDGPIGNRLFVSDDDGTTWRLQQEAAGAFFYLTALPDGVLLDGTQLDGGGIACSVDNGTTWARRCRR